MFVVNGERVKPYFDGEFGKHHIETISLDSKPLSAPRLLDWDLLADVHIKEDVKCHLSLLDLEYFEDVCARAYQTLSLVFFSTIAMHEEGKYLTSRLKGKEYKITDKVLCDIYKLKTKDPRANPMGFKVDSHWPLLSPCETYKKTGASSDLISDVALGVVHKYLYQMIFGKRESNKVSEQ
ncbi:glutaryl-CoA dehydrogenase [Striga asiatica]|uniref:Glutaryl-CoA dehydrogenase n=1 Tax=Striga asiatica TaxID=4170 RepID=A0A5A7QZU2_STRAF|nr:glutaryl-CoA dehydrogenase [Striga asiatica]